MAKKSDISAMLMSDAGLRAVFKQVVEKRRVRFPQIWRMVEEVMNRHTNVAHPDLDAILRADQWAREEARRLVGK